MRVGLRKITGWKVRNAFIKQFDLALAYVVVSTVHFS